VIVHQHVAACASLPSFTFQTARILS